MDNKIKEKMINEEKHDFESLQQLVALLRSPGGCPWDIEQTHDSIRSDLIEETYEVIEAIDNADSHLMREELGDLLFQIIFHCDMEREAGNFEVGDIIQDVCDKMILRHPHVFSSTPAADTAKTDNTAVAEKSEIDTAEKVVEAWDKIKKTEKSRLTVKDELIAVPKMLPALMRCQKICGKAMKNGYLFDFDDANNEKTDDELIDELFQIAAVLKKRGINAEEKLTKKIDSFIESY